MLDERFVNANVRLTHGRSQVSTKQLCFQLVLFAWFLASLSWKQTRTWWVGFVSFKWPTNSTVLNCQCVSETFVVCCPFAAWKPHPQDITFMSNSFAATHMIIRETLVLEVEVTERVGWCTKSRTDTANHNVRPNSAQCHIFTYLKVRKTNKTPWINIYI